MPRKPKAEKTGAEILAPIPAEILDQFVRAGPLTAEDVETAMRRFKKALIERALGAELTSPSGLSARRARSPSDATNHRNGTSGKTVLTDDGPVPIDVPRDREGTFEPQLIGKHERRFTGFDDKVIALYARGLTVREIQAFLKEMYAVEVSPDLISAVTDAVVAEVTAWQSRPLEPMYPVVFFDALRVKIRDEATVRSKAVYLALAVLPDGTRDILGHLDRADRGREILAEGLHGSQNARLPGHPHRRHRRAQGHGARRWRRVFPRTTLQTCIVHLLRHSLDYANWKQRKPLAAALRAIYTAPSADAAQAALDAFERGAWGQRFPTIVAKPGAAPGPSVIPFFAFPPDDPARDLHDQRARERARAAAQDHQDAGPLSERRGRHQTDLAGPAEHHGEVGALPRPALARGHESVRDPLRRAVHAADRVECTRAWTLPSCGRQERAHRDLENRTERGFPQRPHALFVVRSEQKNGTSITPHTQNS